MQASQELKDRLIKDLAKCGISRAYVHCGSLMHLYVVFASEERRSPAVNMKIREMAKPFMKSWESRDDVMVSDVTGYKDRLDKLLPKGHEELFGVG